MTLKLIKSVEISHSPESLFHSVINLAQLVSPSVALTAEVVHSVSSAGFPRIKNKQINKQSFHLNKSEFIFKYNDIRSFSRQMRLVKRRELATSEFLAIIIQKPLPIYLAV